MVKDHFTRQLKRLLPAFCTEYRSKAPKVLCLKGSWSFKDKALQAAGGSWYKMQVVFIIAIFFLISPCAAFAAERYTVVGKTANIRTGPGTKYDVFCKAEKYYPLNIIKKSGNWYKVKDFEGDVGWIHKSLVKKMLSVITIKPKCNIRSGPGTKYQIVFQTNEGVPFKVIKRNGKWINVQHSEGHKGWIHKSLVW